MSIKLWNGSDSTWATASSWGTAPGTPQAGDLDIIQSGTVNAQGVNTGYQEIWVDATHGNESPTLFLDNTNLAAGSYLLVSGTHDTAYVQLANTAMLGVVFDNVGSGEFSVSAGTSATNDGWWGVGSSTYAVATLDAYGSYANAGMMDTGKGGTFNVAMPNAVWNYGVIQADAGGRYYFISQTDTGLATLDNLGKLNDNGMMYLDANVSQDDRGQINVGSGATLTLGGATAGGLINMMGGSTMAFIPTQHQAGPLGAMDLTSLVEFTGPSATIDLGQAVTAAFVDTTTHELVIDIPYVGRTIPIAQIHLAGSYSSSQFSVQGTKVIFTAHPS